MSDALFHTGLSDALRTAGVTTDAAAINAAARDLATRHAEPARAYHTATHIGAMLADFATVRAHAQSPATLIFAILFHDAVYDPRRHDNEAASATFAVTALATLGLPPAAIHRVCHLIAATQHGAAIVDAADTDCALLLDLDLATLGGTPTAYRTYAAAIRTEYAHVPDALYRAGRTKVLQGFLAQPSIYRTRDVKARLEARARRNLAQEIAELEQG